MLPDALFVRAVTRLGPRNARSESNETAAFGFAAGGLALDVDDPFFGESPAFQAAITITISTAIAASANSTTFVSIRRFRRCGRAAERRTRGSCSSPLTKR